MGVKLEILKKVNTFGCLLIRSRALLACLRSLVQHRVSAFVGFSIFWEVDRLLRQDLSPPEQGHEEPCALVGKTGSKPIETRSDMTQQTSVAPYGPTFQSGLGAVGLERASERASEQEREREREREITWNDTQ